MLCVFFNWYPEWEAPENRAASALLRGPVRGAALLGPRGLFEPLLPGTEL
jgi:hypothetical protein